jgi:hypothetical protein
MGRSEEDIKKAYVLRITEHAFQIHINPSIFPECHEIPTTNKIYRKAICLAWLIIFKIKPLEIVILGIIHQHRRPSRIKRIRTVK